MKRKPSVENQLERIIELLENILEELQAQTLVMPQPPVAERE